MSIEQEINPISEQTIAEDVDIFVGGVELEEQGERNVKPIWLAGPQDKIDGTIDYIARRLQIAESSLIQYEISLGETPLIALSTQADQIANAEGSRLLIVARGYERLLTNPDELGVLTKAHKWDQIILEMKYEHRNTSTKNPAFSRLFGDKQVIFITTISPELGEEVYKRALYSTVTSQFNTRKIVFPV